MTDVTETLPVPMAEPPKIRRVFGMPCALPSNKSGFWKDEVLPEEIMEELREEYFESRKSLMSQASQRKEAARKQAEEERRSAQRCTGRVSG
jgi:hypothetical protein